MCVIVLSINIVLMQCLLIISSLTSTMFIVTIAAFCCIFSLVNAAPHTQKFEKCKMEVYQKKFDILPGRGWDNLQNQPMGQIFNLNFSKCQFSQDNIYLIPDFVSMTPTKMSEVILSADSFTHFSNYTSVTSQSINVEAHGAFYGVSVSGSFSQEKEQVKNDQLQTKSSIIRVQLRYNLFKSIAEPDAQLHPTFRNRIIDIAGLLIENKDSLYPQYLADMIIRDYGTHVIHSIDAGAVLSKVDSLDSSYIRKMNGDTSKITVTASASFGSIFGMSAKYSNRVSTTEVNEYDKSSQKTRIETHGGTLYGANFSLDEWRLSVPDNMIPIDKTGDPIYYVITPKSLRELDDSTVNQVYNLLKDAVKRYYSANARIGCMDINAPNFNADANIDAKNCESPKVNFTFGGVFQTCSGRDDQCNSIRQVNPLTGGYTCPAKYQSVLLNNGQHMCREYCSGWWLWKKCHTDCSYYQLYWCYPADVSQVVSGFRFGGFISPEMKSCPLEYFPMNVGRSAQMCVSVNNNPLDIYAIKFGGLYSCKVGNALAREYVTDKGKPVKATQWTPLQQWPKTCAKGYISHLVTIDQGCEIAYCTETNKVSLGTTPMVIRPPFVSLNYNPNSTKVVVFSTADGKVMIKSHLGNWETDEVKIKERKIILSSVLGTFFTVCLLAAVALFLQRRSYKKKLADLQRHELLEDPVSGHYGSINENNESA